MTVQPGTALGDKLQWEPTTNIWVKRRNWITLDVDPTGVVDASPTVTATLATAGQGRCVQYPDGFFRHNSGFTIPAGVALVGSPRGMRRGSRLYSGLTGDGSQLNVYGTGDFITMGINSTVDSLSFYYPEQAKSSAQFVAGAPKTYGYTLVLGPNQHGCTVTNVTAINPFKFLRTHDAHGWLIENVWAYPLSLGINIGHVADVSRIANVHFNPANDYEANDTLWAWVRAYGTAFLIDGIQMLNMRACHAIGYNFGIDFRDADGDIATYGRIVYGECNGLNLEDMAVCIRVAEPNALGYFKFTDAYLVPRAGSSGTFGVGVRFEDTHVPTSGISGYPERPTLMFSNLTAWSGGGGCDRVIWMLGNSYGKCSVIGGDFHRFVNQGALLQSSHCYVRLIGVDMPVGLTRTSNPGGGQLIDQHGFTVANT